MHHNWQNNLTSDFEKFLHKLSYSKEIKELLLYSLLPPGKLFRSSLICHLAHDLKISPDTSTHLWCYFTEIHHTYTLIHDDLPAMDNDDFRRGRASSHRHFNEGKAILAGDALLILSFETLAKISPPLVPFLLKISTWATGKQGLIYGQYLDLYSPKKSFTDIYRIHELKTSRLIQLSIMGIYAIKQNRSLHYEEIKLCLKMGSHIGIIFQLLDDLDDYNEVALGTDINPFKAFTDEALLTLNKCMRSLKVLLDDENLKQTYLYLRSSYLGQVDILLKNKSWGKNHPKNKMIISCLENLPLIF